MVNAANIKKLRELTGAGIVDCKKALQENGDDLDKATDWLRKQGIAQAAKKSSRVASQGVVAIKNDNNKATIIELNSETDFVAKNESFQKLANQITEAISTNPDIKDANELVISETSNNIKDEITNAISVIGENIQLRRFKTIENSEGFIQHYIHSAIAPNQGKIGILISIKCDNVTEDAKTLAKQIAMHIAASKPVSLNSNEIPKEVLDREIAIFSDQAKASGKPENIIEKMVEGRIRKFQEEVVLLEQAFVIDGKTPVKELIANFEKDNNLKFEIKEFTRFELGEGIEKNEENFADEVNATVAGAK